MFYVSKAALGKHFYLKFLSICYGLGTVLHVLDVLNLRLNFYEMNLQWKLWIGGLLVADVFAAIGLWKEKNWGEILFVNIAVTQLIAYTQFKDFFGDQSFLIWFHGIAISIYGLYFPIIHVRSKQKMVS